MRLVVGFAVLLLLLLLLPNPQAHAEAEHRAGGNVPRLDYHVAPMQEPPVAHTVNFHVARDDYSGFLNDLGAALMNNPARRKNDILKVPVLPPQRRPEKKPARWIDVCLFGKEAAETTTIRIRDDNIYLVGFTNRTNHWHVFQNNRLLIPSATALPIGGRYSDLVGRHTNLPDQTLGKQAALEAVRLLENHGRVAMDSTATAKLGASLAKLCVMIAEAARFKGIRLTVTRGWNGSGSHITAQQAELVVLWCKISRALLNWERAGTWAKNRDLADKGNIHNEHDAADTIAFLLLPIAQSGNCNDDGVTCC